MSNLHSRVAHIISSFAEDVFHLHQDEDKDKVRVNSRREHELSQCLDPEDLKPAYSLAEYAVFLVTVDHMHAIAKALTSPTLTFAPWASARCVLEACSLAYWLSDTKVDYRERACRILDFRLNDMKNALALKNTTPDFSEGVSAKATAWEKDQLANLLAIANRFGLHPELDKNGRPKKFGNGMPRHTNLAKIAFGADVEYRLLSGATHGQFYASELSTMMLDSLNLDGSRNLVRHISTEDARRVSALVMEWFAKAAWEMFKIHGWQIHGLAKVFEEAYGDMDIQVDYRFWRSDRLTMVRP